MKYLFLSNCKFALMAWEYFTCDLCLINGYRRDFNAKAKFEIEQNSPNPSPSYNKYIATFFTFMSHLNMCTCTVGLTGGVGRSGQPNFSTASG